MGALALAGARGLAAQPTGVLLTGDEALALAFPGCRMERRTVYLTTAQRAVVERASGGELQSAVIHPYLAHCGDRPGGTAYFDVHRVRTLQETLLVAIDGEDVVRRVEVVAFHEPRDYLPRDAWYHQFEGERLDERSRLARDVPGVAGATLTAHATSDAVRRVLTIHQVLGAAGAGKAAAPQAAAGERPAADPTARRPARSQQADAPALSTADPPPRPREDGR